MANRTFGCRHTKRRVMKMKEKNFVLTQKGPLTNMLV